MKLETRIQGKNIGIAWNTPKFSEHNTRKRR